MTGAKHSAGYARTNSPNAALIVIGGTLLSVSLSLNAVLYVLLNWRIVPN